ncbi:MAG: hypothetical protein KF861_08295, partial [Planctomycetaceae bacterium]|nr:hypothetical protein [Planctomycetaceae bacterium]
MSFIYTPRDVRKELESDPKHGPMFALVLKEFDKRGFGMGVQDLGFFGSWKVSERGITIHTGASDIAKAAAWAKNGLREWAKIGITEPKQYFGEIAREWAKSQRASCTKCLGSTLDFLYLFSMNGAGRFEGTNEMYPITDSIRRDLKGILLWVFVNWWDISIVQGLDSAKVETDQSDLHPDYHDSQPGLYDEDQTHHFALYFYVGVKVGASKLLLDPVL